MISLEQTDEFETAAFQKRSPPHSTPVLRPNHHPGFTGLVPDISTTSGRDSYGGQIVFRLAAQHSTIIFEKPRRERKHKSLKSQQHTPIKLIKKQYKSMAYDCFFH